MREIRDSEDEDDLEMEDEHVDVLEKDAPHVHMSNNVEGSSQIGEKGTGSTESLKRAIQNVHRAHFQDASSEQQGQSNSAGYALDVDANASRNSQGALSSAVSLPEGTSLYANVAPAQSSSRDTIPIAYGSLHPGAADDQANMQPGHTPEKLWNLQGTLQEDWAHHEPMGLFPQMSSTIPDATATQERLLAEVLEPGFLGVDPEVNSSAPKYEPHKSSVPWSEYLKSSYKDSSKPSQPAEQHFLPSQTPISLLGETLRASVSEGETAHARNDTAELHMPPTLVLEDVAETGNTSEYHHQHHAEDEAAAPQTRPRDPEPNLEDDPIAVDLPPEEQYKPRPSRSRSERIAMDEINFAVVPKKALRKTRRSKTADDVGTTCAETTPTKIRQICDMGFTPGTTRKALRQHNGDVTHTIEWLVASGNTGEDELTSSVKSKPQSRKKRNAESRTQSSRPEVSALTPEEPITETHISLDTSARPITDSAPTRSPNNVKVVIPKSKKRAPLATELQEQEAVASPSKPISDGVSKNSAKRKGIEEAEPPVEEVQAPADQPPATKKRGRGRPKKAAKQDEPVPEEVLETIPQQAEDTEPIEGVRIDEVPEASNAQAPKIAQEPNINLTPAPPLPESPPETKAKLPADPPVSASKSKTPYRVGLSKRARIAPLLRTLKK